VRYRFPAVAEGNPGLREESLSAYELGYTASFGATLVGAAVYVNDTKGMIQFTRTGRYTSAAPPPAWPLPAATLDELEEAGRGLPSRYSYSNFPPVRERGVELSVDAGLTRALRLFANYSWQSSPEPEGFDPQELNVPPAHRINVGGSADLGRLFASVSVNRVDRAFWQGVPEPFHGWTEPYTLTSVAVGVRSTDRRMTAAIRASNVFDERVQQHAFGDIVGRQVVGEVTLAFGPGPG
jgi:outer membrane receptor protein involved in Fe transport